MKKESNGRLICFSADTLVTFERSYPEYLTRTQGIILKDDGGNEYFTEEWIPKDNRKYWHIIYNTPQDKIREVVALAKQRHAGLVMVTSATLPNPYGTLPNEEYMKTLIDAVEVGGPLIVPATPLVGEGERPSPPTGLKAIDVAYKSVGLEWLISGEADTAVVYLSNKEVARLPGYLNQVTIGNLAIGSRKLEFKVRAVGKDGTESAFSNTVVVDTKPLPGGRSIVNVTIIASANQTKYEADILVPFTFTRVFVTGPDSDCTYPAYAITTDRGFVCAKWMVENEVFYKYSGTERDPKTKLWPFKWTPSGQLNNEGKNTKIDRKGFHYTWFLPIGTSTIDTNNLVIEGEGDSPKTDSFLACPCHWKAPDAVKKDGSTKYCEGKQMFCAYNCTETPGCSGSGLFSRVKMCDKAIKQTSRDNHTYRSNGNTEESGGCSKNILGLGCSVTIRGRDKGGKGCEITGDGLKQAYEDIKAAERGNCLKCPGTKDLGNGCSVSIDYTRGCSSPRSSSVNNMVQSSGETGNGQSLVDGVMYSSMGAELLG